MKKEDKHINKAIQSVEIEAIQESLKPIGIHSDFNTDPHGVVISIHQKDFGTS
jgi:hypothetical protein